MEGWPVVARDVQLRDALHALRHGSGFRGVVLAGPVGVGKSTMARSLADAVAAEGASARHVFGSRVGRSVPFAAFHGLLSFDDAHEPAAALASAHRTLSTRDDLLLVIDDAQFLDEMSALLAHRLAVSGPARLIVVVGAGATPPDVVTAMWKEGFLRRIDIEPFSRAHTGQLVRAVLDGEVDTSLIDHLHDFSSGSPLVLRSVITAARSEGSLVEEAGHWRLTGTLPVTAELTEQVASQLDALGRDERDVVEIVSAAGVLDWAVLRTMCDVDAVARAERHGMIELVDDGSVVFVRPTHSLVAEVTRQLCRADRMSVLNTSLAQKISLHVTDATPADVRIRIQLALLSTLADITPDLDLITAAAASAVSMSDLAIGERLARFAWERGGASRAALVLAEALTWQGRGTAAEALLAGHEPDDGDDVLTARWDCLRAANLFFGCGQVDEARLLLATVRRRVVACAAASLVSAMEVAFAFFGGDFGAVHLGLADVEHEKSPEAAVWTAVAAGGAWALTGRFDEVPRAVDEGLRALRESESGPQRHFIGLAQVLAATGAGQLTAADRWCQQFAATSTGSPEAEAVGSALAGHVALARGRPTEARLALRNSLWPATGTLPVGWTMLVSCWLTQAEALLGNIKAGAAALSKAEEAYGPQGAVFLPELELARAWTRAATGEIASARSLAARAAAVARRSGLDAVELHALHAGLRFGDRSHAGRLRQLAQRLSCPLATAVVTHSSGLAGRNPDALERAAEQFTAIGALAAAADTWADAAREHASSGNRVRELECVTRAHALARRYGFRTPRLADIPDPLTLTDREWDVAHLVGDDLSNREIAERLELAVRTVDGHLGRIFTKLRIDDRRQLAHLMRLRAAGS